jgi:enoyl-CoA hydratase/carnithine racemase
MEYTQIQCQTSGQILTLTLNRPEKLNAFNSLMCKEIVDALVRADKDDDIKAIIVTGAGRAFCSGLDLSPESRNAAWRIDTSATQDMGANRDPVGVITLTIYDMITPVIAAINGPAIGAGITMTLSMDIRLASENAVIGFPFTRRGLTNEGASSWFLPRLVGMGKAMEWIITGRLIPAGEALSYGLINELVSPDDLLARAFLLPVTSRKIPRQFRWRSAVNCCGKCIVQRTPWMYIK